MDKYLIFILLFSLTSILGSDIPKSTDQLIPDPHLGDQAPSTIYCKLMDISQHPKYDMIKKNDFLKNFFEGKNYCSVHGAFGYSDINSLLYLLYEDLRNPGSKQHVHFFNSVIKNNLHKLENGKALYNRADFTNAKNEIFPRVKYFKDLTSEDLKVLHRCFTYIAASYMVENKVREAKIFNRTGDIKWEGWNPVVNTPKGIMELAGEILSGQRHPSVAILEAIHKKLDIDIAYVYMIKNMPKYLKMESKDDNNKISSPERKEVWLFWYENFTFAPIIIQ